MKDLILKYILVFSLAVLVVIAANWANPQLFSGTSIISLAEAAHSSQGHSHTHRHGNQLHNHFHTGDFHHGVRHNHSHDSDKDKDKDKDKDNGCEDDEQVAICHYPPGNPANPQNLCVGSDAVAAHVNNHADTVGKCDTTEVPCVLNDDDFVYGVSACSSVIECSGINKLQILYDPNFLSTPNAGAPNITIQGWDDASFCRVDLAIVSGGKKCGYKIGTTGGKVNILTDAKGKTETCEMIIELRAPRDLAIQGDGEDD